MAIGDYYPNIVPVRQYLKEIYDYLSQYYSVWSVHHHHTNRIHVHFAQMVDTWTFWNIPGYKVDSCIHKDPHNWDNSTVILEPVS